MEPDTIVILSISAGRYFFQDLARLLSSLAHLKELIGRPIRINLLAGTSLPETKMGLYTRGRTAGLRAGRLRMEEVTAPLLSG